PLQAVAQRYLRRPAEQLASAGDVGLTLLGIVDGESLEDDLRARAGQTLVRCRCLGQRGILSPLARSCAGSYRLRYRDHAPDQIADEAERARLATVAEDGDGPVREGLTQEGGDRAPIVGAHPRTVGVEDPHDRRIHALLAVVGHRQRLGVALGLVVDA